MRISSILASTLSLTLATFALADASSDVIDLTPSNFKSVVDPEKLILVEFFAPWYALISFSISHRNSLFSAEGAGTARRLLLTTKRQQLPSKKGISNSLK